MEPVSMEIDAQQVTADSLPFARSYQIEALEQAIKRNTIVFLETGSGKTLIAIMLLRSYAYHLRKPSPFLAVFLVPKVVLVSQQAEAISMNTDLIVGKYWGEMGVDYWDADTWKREITKHEVLVMTPQILLNGLRHSFFKLNMIKVLILDECHHASGKDPYACIMKEFYHRQLQSGNSDLPRIFGMTASPIKSKGAGSDPGYWKKIHQLETLMNSKVYTCISESVLAKYVPFSTPKFKLYKQADIPRGLCNCLTAELQKLKLQQQRYLEELDISATRSESIKTKLSKIDANFIYCLKELGVWLASKAAEYLSFRENDPFSWGPLDVFGEKAIKNFSLDAFRAFSSHLPPVSVWAVGTDVKADMDAGFITSKVFCLIELLLEYRRYKDIRCIVFVERVITAVVLEALLGELLPKYISWKTKYVAGNKSGLQSQTRKKQNEIVAAFREGLVNIIVATSILEEGLDVQSCNLVIRFDPSATICSFIQSRGRARMKNSDYVLMVQSGDSNTLSRLKNYLSSGDKMRKEALQHASVPCLPLNGISVEDFFCVESTGAIVTLSSSVSLIYFYCARLPSDGYFKPAPRCAIDKETQTCTLYLPKSCPLQSVSVQGNIAHVKQAACLEACRQLHQIGALTDNLVPDIVVEEADAQKSENAPYNDEHPIFFPPELVNKSEESEKTLYHCYLIELKQNFDDDIPADNIVLGTRMKLESEILEVNFQLEVEQGVLTVNFMYVGFIELNKEQVHRCKKFQVTIFKALMERKIDKLTEVLEGYQLGNHLGFDYLLLPSSSQRQRLINWECVSSVLFSSDNNTDEHTSNCLDDNARFVHTKNGLLCECMIRDSLVYTPHNGHVYCINGFREHLDANSYLRLSDGVVLRYKEYYETKHNIQLRFDQQTLLSGRHVFPVKNYIQSGKSKKDKESSRASVELPPELCHIIMSPVSLSTLYSFTFFPSIMHRLQSLLIALNLKKMLLDHCMQNVTIPVTKVLEAVTTKKCQESFHLESLETLGDSFLKYAASQQLFRKFQNHHEGLLSVKKDGIISNAALCRLGCEHSLPGFIRMEPFDPKKWIIPGDYSSCCELNEFQLSNTRKTYIGGRKKIKSKTVADVVEALIGAFLSTGGEIAGIIFLNWIGIKVDFEHMKYERSFHLQAEKLFNVRYLESLLNYSFRDRSLLVEALTHGSYMLPEIPRCYQRLEFLGDAVLDYLITLHLFNKYPRLSPGFLTDMRSASVNNDCYAQSAVKHGLHKHILHASQELQKQITLAANNFSRFSADSTFGWDSETSYPKVLGDIIESLAGAILVDSDYNKEVVFSCIRPLLDPLITPETVKFHPVRELNELCQKMHFTRKKAIVLRNHGVSYITVEVDANGTVFKHTSRASDKGTAKKLACKEVLNSIKASILD